MAAVAQEDDASTTAAGAGPEQAHAETAPATEAAVTAADFEAALARVRPSLMRGLAACVPPLQWDEIGGLEVRRCPGPDSKRKQAAEVGGLDARCRRLGPGPKLKQASSELLSRGAQVAVQGWEPRAYGWWKRTLADAMPLGVGSSALRGAGGKELAQRARCRRRSRPAVA